MRERISISTIFIEEEYKKVIIFILKYLQLRIKIKIIVSHPINIEIFMKNE